MKTETIIIDCDPGQDDAVALLLAIASPQKLNLLGITTVAGNVSREKTQRNARLICDLAGSFEVPIYAGCLRPLVRDPINSEYVHGNTGVNGLTINQPVNPLQKQHAVDFIIDTLNMQGGSGVTLVATGPLTNIAMAIRKTPSISSKIKQIVMMGGAMFEGGNITPSAEFNMYADPDSAKIVFQSGIPITMIGLDVTHKFLITQERRHVIKKIGGKVSEAVYSMLEFASRYDEDKYHSSGTPLHDPCTILYLLSPELFEFKNCSVEIETQSILTIGHTAVDFWEVTQKDKNVYWAYNLKDDYVFDLLCNTLAKYR